MKLKTILTIDAIATALFSLAFIFVPAMAFGTFGVDVDNVAAHLIRTSGAVLIGVAIMAWFGRDSGPTTARNGLVIGLVVLFAIIAINDTIDTLNGTLNAVGWSTVVLTGVLAILTAISGLSSKS